MAPTPEPVTFVFTDLEGSTTLWEQQRDLMASQLAMHDEIVAGVAAAHGGHVFVNMGDGVGIAFTSPDDALAATIDLQRRMREHPWSPDARLAIRAGIHLGIPEEREGNYFGPPLNRTARIMAAGHGGQVLVSDEVVAALTRPLPPGTAIQPMGEHRLKGIAELVPIHQVLAPGLPSSFPPLRTLDPVRHNIPVPLTRIIGRDREVQELADLVRRHRLVTVTAPGGSGKTRLAVEVAARSTMWVPGGVHVVELAAINSGEHVLQSIVDLVLGPEPMPSAEGDLRRLAERITDTTLVVVDNCEHLIDDVATVVEELIASCRHLHLLATSREALRLPGEVVYRLDPLSLERDALHESVAAELFVERARAAAPDADLSDLGAVEDLCARLDGLPLAIELAASRLDAYSLDDVATRLDDVLRGSVRRGRSSARHGTIEAAIRWSYDMLAGREQQVLAAMSVFAGSFDRPAAGAVCASEGLPDGEVDEILDLLVEKSLVAVTRGEFGMRFQLLQLVRDFASRRLDELGTRSDVQRRFGRHYAALAVASNPALEAGTEPDLVRRLGVDEANFAAVLERRDGSVDARTARKLALSLHTYWEESGRLRDGVRRLRTLLEPADPADFLWVATLNVCASYHAMCGMLPSADELFDLVRSEGVVGPGVVAAGGHFALGFRAIAVADLDAAVTHFAAAAALSEELDRLTQREALMIAGTCASFAGDTGGARAFFGSARAVPPPEQAWFPIYADVMERSTDVIDGEQDISPLVAAVDALTALRLDFRTSVAVPYALMAFACAGRFDLVQRFLPAALEPPRRSGHLWSTLLGVSAAAWTAAKRGDHEKAMALWGAQDATATRAWYEPVPLVARIEAPLRAATVEHLGARGQAIAERAAHRDIGQVVDELLASALLTGPSTTAAA